MLILLYGVQTIPFTIDSFRFLLQRKNYNPLLCAPFVKLTFCTSIKSNLYLANSLAPSVSAPALYRLLTFHVPNLVLLFFV
jgi:hypothetical protein